MTSERTQLLVELHSQWCTSCEDSGETNLRYCVARLGETIAEAIDAGIALGHSLIGEPEGSLFRAGFATGYRAGQEDMRNRAVVALEDANVGYSDDVAALPIREKP